MFPHSDPATTWVCVSWRLELRAPTCSEILQPTRLASPAAWAPCNDPRDIKWHYRDNDLWGQTQPCVGVSGHGAWQFPQGDVVSFCGWAGVIVGVSHNLGHTRHLEEVPGAAERLLAEHRPHLGGGHLGVVRVGAGGGGHEPRGGDQGTCHDVTNYHKRLVTYWPAQSLTDLRNRGNWSSQSSMSDQQHNSGHPQNLMRKTRVIKIRQKLTMTLKKHKGLKSKVKKRGRERERCV